MKLNEIILSTFLFVAAAKKPKEENDAVTPGTKDIQLRGLVSKEELKGIIESEDVSDGRHLHARSAEFWANQHKFTWMFGDVWAVKASYWTLNTGHYWWKNCAGTSISPYDCHRLNGDMVEMAPHYLLKTAHNQFVYFNPGSGHGGVGAGAEEQKSKFYIVDFDNNNFAFVNTLSLKHLAGTWNNDLMRQTNSGPWEQWTLEFDYGATTHFALRNHHNMFGYLRAHPNGHMDWAPWNYSWEKFSFIATTSTTVAISHSHRIQALCSDGQTPVVTRYIGEKCDANGNVLWYGMYTINPRVGLSSNECKWSREQYGHNAGWLNDWVGQCGQAPRNVPGLPTGV